MKGIRKTLSKYTLNEEDDSPILNFVRGTNISLSKASKIIKGVLSEGDFYRYWNTANAAFLELTLANDHLLKSLRQYNIALSMLERDKKERERTEKP